MNFLRYTWPAILAACSQGAAGPPTTVDVPTATVIELQDPATCKDCHPKQYQDWSGSMHAYASDDPLFLALNKRGQAAGVGTFCVKCHAPMAVHAGTTDGGIDLANTPKPLHGITCYFCHNVDTVIGTHDNPLQLADDTAMRGEYADAVPNKAHPSKYSTYLDRDRSESAQMCGACHDIVNQNDAHIERTYSEWQDSVYSQSPGGSTCGQCHTDVSKTLEPIAEGPKVNGVFARRTHSHKFPGVDLALTDWPEADAQKQAVQAFVDTDLQTSLCVVGFVDMPGANLMLVVDNVAAGHRWPSGAAQDRRLWFEITAYKGDTPIYTSGIVPEGTAPTDVSKDPDFWLLRDCMFDSAGKETHNFWDAATFESNSLPAQLTFVPSDPRYYKSHIFQNFPRAVDQKLDQYPDRVTMQARVQAFPLELYDELFADPADEGFTAEQVQAMRAKLAPLTVGNSLEWTLAAATDPNPRNGGESYLDSLHRPINCVSKTNLKAAFDKDSALNHKMCAP